MSFIHVFEYCCGLGVFGFLYWIMNGIQEEFQSVSQSGNTFDILLYFWTGIIIVYILFGGIWVVRKYNEESYLNGGM